MDASARLNDWLSRLERQHPVSIDLGLERVAVVAERLGLTERPIAGRVITVAGTNGKGSTVAMVEALARAHGLSTATYTSPHLLRYNERLRFDGSEAEDAVLVEGFERVEAARLAPSAVSLTYFEAGTLAALWAIAERHPDVAVLEVGLGGRLDATNIIDPDVAVITTVALDHADFLGSDVELIGREKAGILRPARPAVLGRDLTDSVFRVADELGCPTWRLGDAIRRGDTASGWHWEGQGHRGEELSLAALPDPGLPLDNAALALQAVALAAVALDADACRRGLESVSLPGRMQWLGRWCLDVAHNPHAATYLAARLAAQPRPPRRLALLGMLADKDAPGVIEALSSQVDAWVAVGLDGPRGRNGKELRTLLEAYGQTVVHVAETPREGADWLSSRLAAEEQALVCGSFLTVADVLAWHEDRGQGRCPS
ncbi:MAG: dihydrofolate synthase / folylpolyglutamate synthase [Halomonadaceae bacterium T82-2]|nr:MAG: dihydrofolate synthase / folylpolyglutamate synthase [Halomonadaceae bacterium T82-2]